MNYFERFWPVLIVLVVMFGIRFARYWQWKWTRENTDRTFQLGWILHIYSIGFGIAGLSMWFGLYATAGLSWYDYPKAIEDADTPAKVLKHLQQYHDAAKITTDVLYWFIFFCMAWILNLFAALTSLLKLEPAEKYVTLPRDIR